jgi:hypothetical protein
MNALYPHCKRSDFQELLLSIVREPPGLSVVRNVTIIHLKCFEISLGALDFAFLLWKLQLGFILSAFRFANELQNHSSRFVVANDCTGYMGYPFQKRVMLMVLTISFSLLLTQQIDGENISHLIKKDIPCSQYRDVEDLRQY